jgi:YkoY family integral membrane protein
VDLAVVIPTVATIIALEALLSADNAMVLAVIVRPLSPLLRTRAMLYGLIGALVLRGLAIAFAVYLIQLWWVEVLGGLYLIYLLVAHLLALRGGDSDHDGIPDAEEKPRSFWGVVMQLNLVNLAFSIDSILVVVAVTKSYWLIVTGAFIGMALIWLAAGALVRLLDRYPALETVAFALVGWAGVKLVVEGWSSFAEKIIHREDLALHLSQNFFLSVTAIIFVLGSLWAIGLSRTRA